MAPSGLQVTFLLLVAALPLALFVSILKIKELILNLFWVLSIPTLKDRVFRTMDKLKLNSLEIFEKK